MSRIAIVISLLLVIFTAFRSEAQTTDGAVRLESRGLRFLQFLQRIGNNAIDDALSVIKDEFPPGSLSDIEKFKQKFSPPHREKILELQKSIAYWQAAQPSDRKCDEYFTAAYKTSEEISASLDTCLHEVGNATYTRYAETMSIFYQSLTKINIHKRNFEACVDSCSDLLSCTGSLFCMTGRWLEVMWHVPSIYGEKMAYRTNSRTLRELLNAFQDNVQFCLDNRFEFTPSIAKIEAKVDGGRKCKNGS